MAGRPSPISSGATGDVQPVQQARGRNDETVTPPPSTKIAAETARVQLAQQILQIQEPSAAAHFEHFLAPGARLGRRGDCRPTLARGSRPARSLNTVCAGGKRQAGSMMTRTGLLPATRRVVKRGLSACHCAGADDYGIAQRPQTMQVQDVLRAGDRVGVARRGGDEAIETLTQMPDGDRPGGLALQMGRYSSSRSRFGSSSSRAGSHPVAGFHASTASGSSAASSCKPPLASAKRRGCPASKLPTALAAA